MTAQRRSRRRSPVPDQQDRLRALTLDASPAARRLRARIPRPPTESAPPPDDPPIPSAPYAVTARTPYRPPGSGGAPPRGHGARSPGALFRGRGARSGEAAVPGHTPQSPPGEAARSHGARARDHSSPSPDQTRARPHDARPSPGESSAAPGAWPGRDPGGLLPSPPLSGTGPERPARKPDEPTADGTSRGTGPGPWRDPAEGRHRRPERPPSGYTEFGPEPDSLLERLARRWAPNAVLSRRAVLALVVLGALAVALVLALHDRPTAVPAPEMVTRAAAADPPAGEGGGASEAEDSSAPEAAAAQEDLVVHVGGEVEDPGLYTLPPGSRVADAVEKAGGALSGADLDLLNLARPLVDGEQVLVGVPPPAGGSGAGAQGIGGPVNINQADRALLETLPGVGPVIADNIIAYREEHGPFGSVDELLNVSKIGEKVLDSLAAHVTVG